MCGMVTKSMRFRGLALAVLTVGAFVVPALSPAGFATAAAGTLIVGQDGDSEAGLVGLLGLLLYLGAPLAAVYLVLKAVALYLGY